MPRSFRDPSGFVVDYRGRILRAVNSNGVPDLEAFLLTPTARNAMEAGKLVRSVRIPPAEVSEAVLHHEYVLEHERIPFPAYPYEWPPEMLRAAGNLTLELAINALEDGFGLKDATPYNVLFRGPEPVFVDVLSFERRQPCASVWMAYAQFVRTILLPLLVNGRSGLPLDRILLGHRDGLEPEAVYQWAGFWRRLTRPFLSLVTLPTLFGRGLGEGVSGTWGDASRYHPKPAGSEEQARYVLKGILKKCARQLAAVAPDVSRRESRWSGYMDHKSLYTATQFKEKEDFVAEALEIAKPRNLLDVGANEGHFSFIAAGQGASVVAIDSDPHVVGKIWRHASRRGLDVLPLVVDLTHPTPAMGWRNQECASFLHRSRGGFDMVMMLAVIHHMLVTERVPLEDLLALISELTREYALIEFVGPEDPMFQRIVRGREDLYEHLTKAAFEAAAASHFELVKSTQINGLHRWLYLFRRLHATG